MIHKISEDAVSPVIGVMLLLVVTIVIAAVVAVFASGVGTDTEAAPTTVLVVSDIHDGGSSAADSWTVATEEFMGSLYLNEGGELRWTHGGITFKLDEKGNFVTEDGERLFEGLSHDPSYDDQEKPKAKWVEWLKQYAVNSGGIKDVMVTINSISGDTLDLKKLSIKVYNSDGALVAEKHQNALSGTITPGDTKTIILDELIDEENGEYNVVQYGEKVEVFVLYGEHVIVSKELKVTGEY